MGIECCYAEHAGVDMARRTDLVVWLTLLLGLVTTAFGVAYGVATTPSSGPGQSARDGVLAAVVGSLGAGVVGAALSIVITRVAIRDSREGLLSALSRTLDAKFTSNEDNLRLLRRQWHHYHVTTLNGKYVWLHQFWRLDRVPGISSLQMLHEVPDGDGQPFQYLLEAGIRGTYAVLLITSEDSAGGQAIEILPHLLIRGHRPYHCGIGLYETWDGTNIIGRVILSREPIVPVGATATVDDKDGSRLDEVWCREFADHYHVLPTAGTWPGNLQPSATPSST